MPARPETGRPYFVMELVKGVPITEYCDENDLTTQERLELFVQVCQAVQHAHQKGIIHRDIKPIEHPGHAARRRAGAESHRLRGRQGHGRADGEDAVHRVSASVGTPEYMSPEQAEMSGLGRGHPERYLFAGRAAVRIADRHDAAGVSDLAHRGYAEMQRSFERRNHRDQARA